MQAKYRAYFELLVFLGLCTAIALVARKNGVHSFLNTGLWAAVVIMIMAGLIFAWWRLSFLHSMDISLLTGALWDLIRMMEVRSRAASSTRATDRKQLLYDFAVEGAQKVAAGRPMPMGDTAALDLTTLAFELMDRNDKDGGGHSNKVNSLRRGLFVFYAIFRLRKPELAYRAMCEHMKIQLRLGEESGIENFTELKCVLNLPTEWPTNIGTILQLERRGLPFGREFTILNAIDAGRGQIFSGVHYIPAGQTGPGYTRPDEILDQMRDYIR